MQIKIKNRFYLKICFIFWFFCAILLVIVSLIAGQFSSLPWISPREKLFINTHASVLSIVLSTADNSKNMICDLNKKLNNTLYLLSSNGKIIYCKKLPAEIKSINQVVSPYAFINGKYLVSDSIRRDNNSYRLVTIKSKSLYPFLLKSQIAYRLLLAAIVSGFICYLIALYLTYPLKIVVNKMSLFAKGKLNVRVGNLIQKRKDEFTEIGNEFDNMANNIESLIQAKQQMLFNVSHELRSPLARQLISLDLLKHMPFDEHDELIAHIEEENSHLNDLISNILTLAKLSTQTFPFKPQKTNITSIIFKAIDNINFEYDTSCIIYQGAQRIHAIADDKLVKIAIENLLKNALSYAGKQDKIIIQGKVHKDKIFINIIDKGPGIDADELPYVFTPFTQSANKKKITSKDSGYGLGLSITKEIIQLHGGDIEALNLEGGGLKITVCLPVMQEEKRAVK